MQKRVHSREFKLEIVRQITTGQKLLLRFVENMAWQRVCFHAGEKNIKSGVKRHLSLRKQKGHPPKNRGFVNLNSFVGSWPWRIRC